MNITISGRRPSIEAGERTYDFGSLPVIMQEKVVRSGKQSHEELLHWHDDLEIIRIRRGSVHCHVNESDFELGPGELCFINFDVLHRVYNTKQEEGDLDALLVSTDMLAQNKDIYEKYIVPIIHNPEFAHIKMDGRNSGVKLISDIFDALYDLITEKPVGYELDVVGYIYMMFRRLYLVYISNTELPTPISADISLQRRMTAFIYEHYSEKITLDDIAGSAGISRSKCAALFKTYTQKTPISFLGSYRLEVAGQLLLRSDEPVSIIAGECGFGEQSYFNRMFLREFGCTPTEWRRRKKQK